MQHVLARKTDGAVRLMRDAGADAGGLAAACFRRGDRQQVHAVRSGFGRHVGCGVGGGGMGGEHGEIVLDRLELADRLAELHALARILQRDLQRARQRAGDLVGAHGGAERAQGLGGDVIAGRRDIAGAEIAVEGHVVARLHREIAAVLERAFLRIDARDHVGAVGFGENENGRGVARERHALRGSFQTPAGAGFLQRQRRAFAGGRNRQRPLGHSERRACKPAGEHGFGERDGRGAARGNAQRGERVLDGEIGAAGAFGQERAGKARVRDLLPQGRLKRAILGGGENGSLAGVAEQLFGHVADEVGRLAHSVTSRRRPRPSRRNAAHCSSG